MQLALAHQGRNGHQPPIPQGSHRLAVGDQEHRHVGAGGAAILVQAGAGAVGPALPEEQHTPARGEIGAPQHADRSLCNGDTLATLAIEHRLPPLAVEKTVRPIFARSAT